MEQIDFIASLNIPIAVLVLAGLLSTVNTAIVDMLKRPITQRFPEWDLWWFVYVGMATGFAIGWLAQVNLFLTIVPEEALGRILSALMIGGGSSLIYKVFGRAPAVSNG